MTLPTALAASCDTYFYEVGNRFYNLPAERGHPLQSWARRFGFGQPTGIDIGGEDRGLLPTPLEARRRTRRSATQTEIDRLWKPGDSIQLAIGQKDLLVTPLQMTRFYALIANGGQLVTPHVVSSVEQPGTPAGRRSCCSGSRRRPPRDTNVDRGRARVDRGGPPRRDARCRTARRSASSAASRSRSPARPARPRSGRASCSGCSTSRGGAATGAMGGKSAIAVCVLIENGGLGGEAAAPAALKVFEAHFGVKATVVDEVPSD